MKALTEGIDLVGVGAIFATALVLGLAYNAASPLGVRARREGPPPAQANPYSNVTVAIAAVRDEPGATVRVQNETVGAEIVRSPSPPPPAPAAGPASPSSVKWSEVKRRVVAGSVVLVDAREAAAYRAGHIPGAVSLPFVNLEAMLPAFSARVSRDTPLVVYCASDLCPVSRAAAVALMERFGYQDVSEMPGGFAEWRVAEPGTEPEREAKP